MSGIQAAANKAAQQPGLFEAVKTNAKACGQWTITKSKDLGNIIATYAAKAWKCLCQCMLVLKDHSVRFAQSAKEFFVANPQYLKALGVGVIVIAVTSLVLFKCCKKTPPAKTAEAEAEAVAKKETSNDKPKAKEASY